MTGKKQNRRRLSLLVAAVIYIAGVIALTALSFNRHKNSHLKQLDAELFGTVAAVRELLSGEGPDFLTRKTENAEPYTTRKQQLQNIARQGGLTLLGAIHTTNGSERILASALQQAELPNDLDFLIPAPQPPEENRNPIMRSFSHPELGPLKLAELYDPDSSLIYFSACRLDHQDFFDPGDIMFILLASGALILLALPLVVVTRRTERLLTLESEALNARLMQDVSMQQTREKELREALSDLERFSSVSVGRESRIMDLKAEVNELLEQMHQGKRYNTESID